jgi:hypothetical protein
MMIRATHPPCSVAGVVGVVISTWPEVFDILLSTLTCVGAVVVLEVVSVPVSVVVVVVVVVVGGGEVVEVVEVAGEIREVVVVVVVGLKVGVDVGLLVGLGKGYIN